MGNEQSTLELEENAASSKGYHVLKVISGSPAFEAGLDPYFDYILFVNGYRTDKESIILTEAMRSNVNQVVTLIVYSSKRQDVREVKITPSDKWGRPEDGLTGCRVRFCDYEGAAENVWHVLTVHPDSPAENAGLQSNTDYVVGSPNQHLREKNDLFKLIEVHLQKPLQLLVYNSTIDEIREVLILPNKDWGGVGYLGCDIGYGYLHRIPLSINSTFYTSKSNNHIENEEDLEQVINTEANDNILNSSGEIEMESLEDMDTSELHLLNEREETEKVNFVENKIHNKSADGNIVKQKLPIKDPNVFNDNQKVVEIVNNNLEKSDTVAVAADIGISRDVELPTN
ncbi:Golgi reassembly-stacking protein 2 [Clydaea vesicula]|uniref:Golgi reassembly-stacking protein 2 n=1 Tax=Clydaea vesicula TaxID=447962 RepID=A0AAD5U6P0_9FUNG|nr:Golgi reassembly-stacking protein 2 [Clydaea vesicula]KAJ3395357.1 Golgi reassembly-stacking protein 2 [Lobulomyces angularis]